MEYGKLGSSEPFYAITEEEFAAFEEEILAPARRRRRRRAAVFLLSGLSFILLLAAAVTISLSLPDGTESPVSAKTTLAISRACSATRHEALCRSSLSSFPGAAKVSGEFDLVHVSMDMTLHRVSKALYGASAIAGLPMGPRLRSAFEDCVELMEDSMSHISQSLSAISGKPGAAADDVRTWLSAALTNHDTCLESLDGVENSNVKDQILERVKDLSELVSNTLAIFSTSAKNHDFDGIPIQNRRRKLLAAGDEMGFPEWVRRKDRRLLQLPVGSIRADFVVSKTGNGTHTTIEQAVKDAPVNSSRRFVIHIRAGRYDENIKIARSKTNLMFVGDGKSYTIIAGSRSVYDNFTTFRTATFAATGSGFLARDITFQNWAGPEKHQAVALRLGSDHSVVYRCNVIGYQDTLYVHSQRQFFRECDIYGTVDFVFGNAAVVLQNCSLYTRKPLPFQKNTVTAQNRKDPNQNTGISIHASRVLPTPDLAAEAANFPSYLGRPWKLYSRTVYMMSYISGHIHPAGWLEWNATFALDTLYYGEYMNYGPGAAVGSRVKWPGYRVLGTPEEAGKFTVSQFLSGATWLPSTGVAFLSGLTL